MTDDRESRQQQRSFLARGALLGVIIVTGSVVAPSFSGTAYAVDQGNWTWGCEPFPASKGGCMYNWEYGYMASSQKDEDFNGDNWHTGPTMNDKVSNVVNRFATVEIQAFRNRGYSNGNYGVTTCVPPNFSRGPYSDNGDDQGLSSFKTSCP